MLRFKETPIQFLIRVNAQEIAIGSDMLAALLLLPSIATIFVLSSSKNVSIDAEATYFTKFCSSLVIKDFSPCSLMAFRISLHCSVMAFWIFLHFSLMAFCVWLSNRV